MGLLDDHGGGGLLLELGLEYVLVHEVGGGVLPAALDDGVWQLVARW